MYAFSIGMCNTVMYIRMYALFTVWAVWFTFLLYSTLKDDRKLDKKFGVKYIVLLTLGVMTQYYFLIFAFFVCLLFGIKIISEKRFIDLRNLFFYSIVSAVLCVLFFPYMLRHLVGGKRGKDSFVALVHFSEWIGDINDLFTTMCKQLYIGKIGFAIIGLIIIYIIYKKKKDIKKEYMYIFFMASVLFFIMISKIAPFASDRYIFGIYPIVFISTIGFVLKQIDSIFVKNNKTVFVILSCCMMLLTLGNYLINDVPYLYKENKIM